MTYLLSVHGVLNEEMPADTANFLHLTDKEA